MAQDRFGALRSMLQRDTLDTAARSELWALITAFAEHSPGTYASTWRPYVAGFPHHFVEPIASVGSVWKLERVLELIPGATFTLSLFGNDMNADTFRALLRKPALEHVSRLEVPVPDPSRPSVRALTDCPHLTRLDDLMIRADFEGGVMKEFASSEFFCRLKKLEITWCALEPREFGVLFEGVNASNLETLELEGNPLDAGCAELFAESRSGARLRRLDLSQCGLFDEGADALARAPMLASLEELRLCYDDLSIDALRAFVGSPHLGALRHLDVGANPTIGDEGVAFLLASPWVRRLETLSLSHAGLTDAGVDAIVASEYVTELFELDLSVNDITSVGVMALAHAQNLKSLRALHVDTDGIDEEAIEALLASPNLSDSAKRTATRG
jgi:hypothetical protein